MKGKWAAGISPRNFTWIIRDRFAVSERPGGFGSSHRKVRREEELLWLRAQGFDRVLSILAGPSNLPAYTAHEIDWGHHPIAPTGDRRGALRECYFDLDKALSSGKRVLLHGDELGDRVMGVVAGYLFWSDRITQGPAAISAVEHLLERSMGPEGRALVADSERSSPDASQ
ncbi:MAG TPA: hypothetical protein VIE15_02615 [Acidimicrobiales bacterium]|jgi:hypothetical protein